MRAGIVQWVLAGVGLEFAEYVRGMQHDEVSPATEATEEGLPDRVVGSRRRRSRPGSCVFAECSQWTLYPSIDTVKPSSLLASRFVFVVSFPAPSFLASPKCQAPLTHAHLAESPAKIKWQNSVYLLRHQRLG